MFVFNVANGFPKEINTDLVNFFWNLKGKKVVYSNHAKLQMLNNDNKHGINPNDIPQYNHTMPIPKDGWSIIEVEHDGKDITKVLVRKALNDKEDVLMPIISQNNIPFVKTLWRNKRNDNHKTLKNNRINSPADFVRAA